MGRERCSEPLRTDGFERAGPAGGFPQRRGVVAHQRVTLSAATAGNRFINTHSVTGRGQLANNGCGDIGLSYVRIGAGNKESGHGGFEIPFHDNVCYA